MKRTITGFINFKKNDYDTKEFHGMHFHACAMSEYGYVPVMPFSVDVEIPDDFNPIPTQAELIKKEIQECKAKASRDLMLLEDKLAKLLCITNEVEA
ncbi:MAG: hypothetical protein HQ445_05480 [Polaromonas sp.]|nr:hypothetical protein [Polaromonas sp.]